MTWKVVPQKRRLVGPYTVDYLRQGDRGEGGHQVSLPDGRRVRVLPDGKTTTNKRYDRILSGLTELQALPSGSVDPVAYLVGCLHVLGASEVEVVGQVNTPAQIISDCIEDFNGDLTADKVIAELKEAGYQIKAMEDA